MQRFRLLGQLILFALLLTVYTLTNSGAFHIIDEVSLFAVTESVAQRGTVDTNAIAWSQWVNSPGEVLGAFGPDGEVYSKKGPAPAFLSVPWYWLITLFARLGLPWGLLQGTMLWNGVITAATAILLWMTAARLGYTERTGAILGLLFGLGTIAWPYANHLFGEPLSAFGLLLCFYGLSGAKRRRGEEAERRGGEEAERRGGAEAGIPQDWGAGGPTSADAGIPQDWGAGGPTSADAGIPQDWGAGGPTSADAGIPQDWGAGGSKSEEEKGTLPFITHHAPRTTPSRPSSLWLAGIGAALAIATVTAHAPLIALMGLYLIVVLWRGDEEAKRRRGADAGIPQDWGAGGPTSGDAGIPQDWGAGGPKSKEEKGTLPFLTQHATRITLSRITHYASRITHHALRITPFILPILGALFLLGWYNLVRFGHPLETGYHFDSGEGFTTPFWQGFWGLVGSPYRGLFWHTPLFFATLLAFPAFLRRHRAEGLLIAALSLTLIALYSTWWMWWGGFAWGPRFLVPLSPFWVLPLAPVMERMMSQELRIRLGVWKALALPILYSSIFMLSFLVQLSAVLVNYVNYEIELRRIFPTDWLDPLRFGPPAQGIGEIGYSPVLGQWRLMAQDFAANTDLAWLWADGTILWPVIGAGVLALTVLLWSFIHWWRAAPLSPPAGPLPVCEQTATVRRLPSAVTGSLSIVATLLFLAVWLTSVANHPRYGEEGSGYRAILAEVGAQAGDDDLLLTIAPYHYQIPMNWLGGIYPGGLNIIGYATDTVVHAEAVTVLTDRLQRHTQIWFVTAGLPPADPANLVEHWLAEHAYKADDRWFDDFRLLRYGTPATLNGAPIHPLDVPLRDAQNHVTLLATQRSAAAVSGVPLPVEIHYRVEAVVDPLRWFVQLLGTDGQLIAQVDTAPLDGYSAFTDLPAGVEAIERVALILPAGLAAGDYQLIAGIYNPSIEGGPRLRSETEIDFVDLGRVAVTEK